MATKVSGETVPQLSTADTFMRFVSTSKKAVLDGLPTTGRNGFPRVASTRQVTSDRFLLAAEHMRAGDTLLAANGYRTSIGRHYYAMYHSARAISFAHHGGDDFENHTKLSRNLPSTIVDCVDRETELTAARLLRNEADYETYPVSATAWQLEAIALSATAATFLQHCETFALENGYV